MHKPAAAAIAPSDTRLLRKGANDAGAGSLGAADATREGTLSADTIRRGGAAGAKLLSYELRELVGAGAMGTVYKATHFWLKRTVALKFIAAHVVTDPEAMMRFQYEARAIGALDHPHIVRATDAGQHDGICFLVTEFVEGEDAARLVARRGPLSAADACQVVIQAALGLQHAHEHGLVHRDVKPSNLLIDRDGVTKLIDFGIARLVADRTAITSTGQMLGTLDFLAPEQASDAHKIDIRADIYSLGCTFYYLLTGEPPFHGPKYQTPAAKIKGHLVDTPPALVSSRGPLPQGVVACIERMMAKAPHNRFSEPAEIAEALAPHARTACLQKLVSDDLCYGLGTHALDRERSVDVSWWPILRRCMVEAPAAAECVAQYLLPSGAASAAQRRRRPLAYTGVVATLAMLGAALFVQSHGPHKPDASIAPSAADQKPLESREVHAGPRTMWQVRPTNTRLQQSSATAPSVPSPASTSPAGKGIQAIPVNTTAAQRAVPGVTLSQSTPKASTTAPAPHTLRPTIRTLPVTITAEPHKTLSSERTQPLRSRSRAGGIEYREIGGFGTPPPGFDPNRLPPGFEDGPPPDWILNQFPPFAAPSGAMAIPGRPGQ